MLQPQFRRVSLRVGRTRAEGFDRLKRAHRAPGLPAAFSFSSRVLNQSLAGGFGDGGSEVGHVEFFEGATNMETDGVVT